MLQAGVEDVVGTVSGRMQLPKSLKYEKHLKVFETRPLRLLNSYGQAAYGAKTDMVGGGDADGDE